MLRDLIKLENILKYLIPDNGNDNGNCKGNCVGNRNGNNNGNNNVNSSSKCCLVTKVLIECVFVARILQSTSLLIVTLPGS